MFEKNYIYHLIQEKCKLYLKYIDDIFLIWTCTLDELNKCIAKINQVHPSIKFYFSYSSNSVNFLDTTVKESSTSELLTMSFKRKTDGRAYLWGKSEHSESLKRNTPYAQALHRKGVCTEDRDFKANCDILSKKLINREYKKTDIYYSMS